MNIAIIGSGISGLTAAYLLQRRHSITLYEAENYVGGHTHTVDVDLQGQHVAVDTGFIVCNDRTYPNFLKLLDQLGVEKTPTAMGFGIRSDRTGIEYSTTSLNHLFAQRRNLVNRDFLGMLRGILRFNRQVTRSLLEGGLDGDISLGDYLQENRYSRFFIDHYIVPMGAAIWSIGVGQMMEFPLLAFARFFHHHGLLTVNDQPQWYFIKGGSQSYVRKLTAPFDDRIKLSTPVDAVMRNSDGVTVKARGESVEYDKVVFATHSDLTLKLLADPSPEETDILSAIRYQHNDIVLHTDTAILPKNRKAWAPWNYHLQADGNRAATLTYNMNMLQQISAPEVLCVTLNETELIDPAKIVGRYDKSHPVFDRESIAAQKRYDDIGGKNNTYFCGAYWFNGFHEDGVNSGLRVARDFGEVL
ncbi:MAG: FAD-dependent oxidoreductase [bacterium]